MPPHTRTVDGLSLPEVHDKAAGAESEEGMPLPLGAVLSLVADMASQHERMEQMYADFGRTLAAAQAAADNVRMQLSPSASPELEVTGMSHWRRTCTQLEPMPLGESLPPQVIGDLDLPLEDEQPQQPQGAKDSRAPSPDVQWVLPEPALLRNYGSSRSQLQLPESTSGATHHLSATQLLSVSGDRGNIHHHTTVRLHPEEQFQDLSQASESHKRCANDEAVRKNAIFRLQARLGKKRLMDDVTAHEVYHAVTALGLVKFKQQDVEGWFASVAELCKTRRSAEPPQPRRLNLARTIGRLRPQRRSTAAIGRKEGSIHNVKAVVAFKTFAELLLDDSHLDFLDPDLQEMSLTVREILFSGDANRLVAELTNVCVDDVAAPNDKPDLLTMMEPVVGVMIIVNGIIIGLESGDLNSGGTDRWFWCNVFFTSFFSLEIALRTFIVGSKVFCFGTDGWWNAFDGSLVALSIFDIVFEAISASANVAPLAVMRILRLLRLTRLVRIFRLRYMRELTLMVRGLVGGLHTLFWAIVLLCFTLYMIACLATSTISRSTDPIPEIIDDKLFDSVPQSVFTCFRCLMGDCNTSAGRPIVKILADRYGTFFALSYFAGMMFVVFGLFNLIIAIYIENTLNAAKQEGEKNKAQRQRESVRIARLTRQLLKKFVAIQRLWTESVSGEAKEIKRIIGHSTFTDIGGLSLPVSKEMFLCLIQDASVQKLMDDLDIPPERAALFDILDADGSGGLEVTELITGLLRVRGEAKKSDIVGTLLAVRVVQEMIREQGERMESLEEKLKRFDEAPHYSPASSVQRKSPSA